MAGQEIGTLRDAMRLAIVASSMMKTAQELTTSSAPVTSMPVTTGLARAQVMACWAHLAPRSHAKSQHYRFRG